MPAAVADDVEALIDHVGVDPAEALDRADEIVRATPHPHDDDEVRRVVGAHRAAALALRATGRPVEARGRVETAIRIADRAGLPRLAAEARVTAAFVLLELGRIRAALSATDEALAVLRGAPAARARGMRALVLQRAGRPREAFAEYDAAIKVLKRAGDADGEARLRHNRALLSIEFGDTRSALADLEASRRYSLAQGQVIDAADALFNMGVALETAGDIPGALATFDQADVEWKGVDRPQRWLARVDTYLAVGLAEAAAANARKAVDWLAGRDWPGSEAHARFLLARCLIADSDVDLGVAEAAAIEARHALRAQQRGDFAALADYLVLTCRLRRAPGRREQESAIELAEALREGGFDLEASDLRLVAGTAALEQGELTRARLLLGPLTTQDRAARLEIRALAWYARALLDEAAGDQDAAYAALRRAWSRIEDQQRMLGASELRAATATHVASVVATGLTASVRRGSPSEVFEWCERGRASALRLSPVRATQDPRLAEALSRLRWIARALDDAHSDGEPTAALATELARAESDVVRLSRTIHGSASPASLRRPAEVRRTLDGACFVELLESDDRLMAVVLTARSARLVPLGSAADAARHASDLAFALRRGISGFGTDAGREAGTVALRVAAAALSEQIVSPIAAACDGSARLVISPHAALIGVPWSLLDGLDSIPVSVAPSATIWCGCVERLRTCDRIALARGPGLPAAGTEIDEIAALHPGSRVTRLDGSEATTQALLDAARDADLLHVAAHGSLRRDNPSFSALHLADGPLTLYDLEALSPGPCTVVLSACDAGAGRTVVAEETFGLAWTLLGSGASSVVAPLLPVPDDAARQVMVQLHRHLVAGEAPAAALCRARAAFPRHDLRALVAASFTAFGA